MPTSPPSAHPRRRLHRRTVTPARAAWTVALVMSLAACGSLDADPMASPLTTETVTPPPDPSTGEPDYLELPLDEARAKARLDGFTPVAHNASGKNDAISWAEGAWHVCFQEFPDAEEEPQFPEAESPEAETGGGEAEDPAAPETGEEPGTDGEPVAGQEPDEEEDAGSSSETLSRPTLNLGVVPMTDSCPDSPQPAVEWPGFPDLTGKSYAQAAAVVRALGVQKISATSAYSNVDDPDDAASWLVCFQSPEPGRKAPYREVMSVRLYVALSGPGCPERNGAELPSG
ncbi:PASTA domain-containing protein [Streptomyces sp. ACA25]|uniref:PASTA domain-containing protein n=1 Tax=Streptomyces sp. ACA25 TaxID=3022596 RepID=UPI0023070FE2|nr:PASTA domain-containing protein [Streptomyces sp. ACA25]MDB1086580.1 PASTA domain-containing protein [Streptomyces sp. ACA25]